MTEGKTTTHQHTAVTVATMCVILTLSLEGKTSANVQRRDMRQNGAQRRTTMIEMDYGAFVEMVRYMFCYIIATVNIVVFYLWDILDYFWYTIRFFNIIPNKKEDTVGL